MIGYAVIVVLVGSIIALVFSNTIVQTPEPEYDPEYIEKRRRRTRSSSDISPSAVENYKRRARNSPKPDETGDQPNGEEDVSKSARPVTQEMELEFSWTVETDVSMSDIGGMNALKEEARNDIVKPLTTGRKKAEKLGIPAPNVLFYGPPGTGKTYFAKALATELELPFVRVSGADITSKWMNESSEKIHTLFGEARKVADKAGGAVIFLDELDSVLPAREGRTHDENRKVVNEFLNHLQDTGEHNIVFIGATNRVEDLDPAATRNGRIDKQIEIDEPDTSAREAVLRAQLADRPDNLSDDQIRYLAKITQGLVAADLEALVLQAARSSAFTRDDGVIKWEDVETAFMKIRG